MRKMACAQADKVQLLCRYMYVCMCTHRLQKVGGRALEGVHVAQFRADCEPVQDGVNSSVRPAPQCGHLCVRPATNGSPGGTHIISGTA